MRNNRCIYMAHICFMYVVVTVWGMWKCFCVADVVGFSLGVLKYVVCLGKGCDGVVFFSFVLKGQEL